MLYTMYRNYCFTINNWKEEDLVTLKGIKSEYYIFGIEVGEKGTPHLQGYIELGSPKRLTTLAKEFDGRAHLEPRKGTQEQAIVYCKKEGQYTEFGKPKEQGSRKDLDQVRQMALAEGMRGVTSICNMQQINVAQKFLTYNEEPRCWKPEVIWIWGLTGSGKSRYARELCNEDVYTKSSGHKWWDGYDAHECCIIDDFRDSWWPLTEMLRLLDRYECLIEVKGGFRQFRSKKIIVTSIYSPKEVYLKASEDLNQLERRIDKVIQKIVTDVTEVTEVILDSVTEN